MFDRAAHVGAEARGYAWRLCTVSGLPALSGSYAAANARTSIQPFI
ncbi:hypothetical protein [Ferribacterium limneticum]|nr:hypothetical protein [Ferribacterium limneticum]